MTTTSSGIVSKGNGDTLQVIAIDSRGFTTSTVYNLGNNLVLYTSPVNNSASTHRDDGVSKDTVLNFNGNFFNNKFGEDGINNAIEEIKYYTSIDNENWSTGFNILPSELTISNNNYSLKDYNIHLDGSSGGFPIGTQYYVKFELSDKLKSIIVQNIIVTNGILARDIYIDNNNQYHEGLNGLANPNYTKEIHGTLNVTGEIYKNGTPIPSGSSIAVHDSYSESTEEPYSANYVNRHSFSGSYNDLSDKPTIPTMDSSYGASTTNGYNKTYINNLNTYDGTERRVGTWGSSALYRKVISGTLNGTYIENGKRYTWIASGLSGVVVRKIEYMLAITDRILSGNTSDVSLAYLKTGGYATMVQVGVNNSLVPKTATIQIVLEYTK